MRSYTQLYSRINARITAVWQSFADWHGWRGFLPYGMELFLEVT
jgi:hypothetical protein